jgi:hypothetical protein
MYMPLSGTQKVALKTLLDSKYKVITVSVDTGGAATVNQKIRVGTCNRQMTAATVYALAARGFLKELGPYVEGIQAFEVTAEGMEMATVVKNQWDAIRRRPHEVIDVDFRDPESAILRLEDGTTVEVNPKELYEDSEKNYEG